MKNSDSNPEDFFRKLNVEFLIHELKDPIAVIETGVRTLLDKQDKFGTLSPRQERTMNRIRRNARKAREMLYSLLEVGRSEAGSFACNRFKPVEATLEVLIACLEVQYPAVSEKTHQDQDMARVLTFLDSYGISLSAAPDLLQTDMHQDQTKYCQIIGNLLKNALHFRGERIDIKMDINKDFLLVAVTDDGPGVEPEHCESIFERYSQGKDCAITPRQGHGLGLAGARVLARCLGGDIELTCSKTEGTKFELRLPMNFTNR